MSGRPLEKPRRRPKHRQNDAPWRAAVIDLRGQYCRACGVTRDLQCDHVMPKSQGGPSVVENGTMLCRRHHEDKTLGLLKYERWWLDEDQIAWLAEKGWVTWDADGQPRGRGYKHFEPYGRLGLENERVEEDG